MRRSYRSLRLTLAPAPLLILAALLLAGCPATEIPDQAPSIPRGSDILLITVDTLRADHLSSYGYVRATSPTIDALAAEGIRFDRPAVQWPKTGPSFASMMTSTYPKDNGIVREIGIPVPEEMTLLAERLAEAGYATRAVVANGALSKEFHYDQGFERYVETWQTEAPGGIDRDGAQHVTDLALGLAAELSDARAGGDERPYFLWVHYLDPHFPYTPPAPFTDRFQNDEHWQPEPRLVIDQSSPRRQMIELGRTQVLDGRDELAFYVARYDAEIAYTDHQIERLLAGIDSRGLRARALTVFTSDHGESLGEHYYNFDHGRFGFQTCLRVPLIFHYPGVLPAGVDPDPVALLHLAPTLLDFAGAPLEDGGWMSGRSLVSRMLGQDAPPSDVVFSEAGYARGGNWQRIAQDGRFKLVLAPTAQEQQWIGGRGVLHTLFDLEADPGETENVVEAHPDDFRRLDSAMRRWLRDKPAIEREAQAETEMDEETRKQLEALGYI